MKIMLDAGHGYDTPGKRTPDGMHEFEFNAAVALHAKMILLTGYEGVEVQFAHDPTGRIDIALDQRCKRANDWKADVYVSIHANAAGDDWNEAEGIETFVYETRPKEAVQLASNIQNQLIRHTLRKNRGIKTADFYVIKKTHMTSVLAECGFMTNKAEAILLKTDSYRQICAQAIVDGLAETYKLKKKEKAAVKPSTDKFHKVQVGAFKDKAAAEKLAEELKEKGYPAAVVKA